MIGESSEEIDFRDTPQDMTPEANSDVSHAHMLKWALDHHNLHFIKDVWVVGSDESPAEEDTDAEVTEATLLELQAKITREEAGTPLTLPATDARQIPEAS